MSSQTSTVDRMLAHPVINSLSTLTPTSSSSSSHHKPSFITSTLTSTQPTHITSTLTSTRISTPPQISRTLSSPRITSITDTITSQTSTSSPSHELNKILGKCTNSLHSCPHSAPKRVSWADNWTHFSHSPCDTLHSTPRHGNSLPRAVPPKQSRPLNDTPITLDALQSFPIDAEDYPSFQPGILSTIHTSVDCPPNITTIIQGICAQPLSPPSQPEFSFKLTREAALRNFCVLQRYHSNIGLAIDAQSSSPLGYGSKFRPIHLLRPLLQLHPYWTKFESLLTQGSDWPLRPILESERHSDVEEALLFGNHKEATQNPTLLRSLIIDDVTHGFALPLPLEKIHQIKGVLLAPLNIAIQETINERGETIPKKRLTHDQSYVFKGSGTSINSRTDKTKLTPCIFGWAIRRLAHWIVCARRKHPNRRIYATKTDFKSAYRWCHLHHSSAAQSCAQLTEEKLALLMLHLTFGGAACPYEWSIISELICDLASAIIIDDNWDPEELFSLDQHLIPPPSFLPDDIPFGEGKELIVSVDINDRGTHEMYLDDLIGLGIDLPDTNNIQRSERAPLLAIHTCARPIHASEPIPRENMASLQKLKAEAQLTEIKTILGWVWDLRRLIISLPEHKYIAWSNDISNLIAARTVNTKALESTIGRLTHLSLVVPHVHHFLSRIRELHTLTQRIHRRQIVITQPCLDDFTLMLDFLQRAREGIDINLITYRRPTHVYRSDACPAGIGGYDHDGFAWRFHLPDHLLFQASINLLEHLAAIITPWVDIIAGRLNRGDCALSMTDSTTSAGWLRRSNFREFDDEVQASARITVARSHARHYMNQGIRDYSQWFRGSHNNVADSLSRDLHLSDELLTSHIIKHFPSQVPENFRIVPLPNEIVSWMTSLLLTLPVKEQYREAHTPTKLGHGDVGLPTATLWDSLTTPTLQVSTDNKKLKYSEPSETLSEKADIRESLQIPWLLQQSRVPSITWLRPSVATANPTQPVTTTDSSPGS